MSTNQQALSFRLAKEAQVVAASSQVDLPIHSRPAATNPSSSSSRSFLPSGDAEEMAKWKSRWEAADKVATIEAERAWAVMAAAQPPTGDALLEAHKRKLFRKVDLVSDVLMGTGEGARAGKAEEKGKKRKRGGEEEDEEEEGESAPGEAAVVVAGGRKWQKCSRSRKNARYYRGVMARPMRIGEDGVASWAGDEGGRKVMTRVRFEE